jgi:hypothetical protein
MKSKVLLATVYGLLVSMTGVGAYLYMDNRGRSLQERTVQIRQVLPAYEDKRISPKTTPAPTAIPETKPKVPNPTQLEQIQLDTTKANLVPQKNPLPSITPIQPAVDSNTKIIEQKPDDLRGSFDQQGGAYDDVKNKTAN